MKKKVSFDQIDPVLKIEPRKVEFSDEQSASVSAANKSIGVQTSPSKPQESNDSLQSHSMNHKLHQPSSFTSFANGEN